MTNLAVLEKNKIMNQLSQYEIDSIKKINKADIKSEFVQTSLCDIKNIIIMKNPNEKVKPQKPCTFMTFNNLVKHIEIQTDLEIPMSSPKQSPKKGGKSPKRNAESPKSTQIKKTK